LLEHAADEVTRVEQAIGNPALYTRMAGTWLKPPLPQVIEFVEFIARHLAILQQQGKARTDYSPRELAVQFSFTLTGTLMASSVQGVDSRRAAQRLTDLFADALNPTHEMRSKRELLDNSTKTRGGASK
jgi:hypothetical protein